MIRIAKCKICGATIRSNGFGEERADKREHLQKDHPEKWDEYLEIGKAIRAKEEEITALEEERNFFLKG